MLLNKHEKKYKHALELQREICKLYRQKRSIEPIKLSEPIQHGYVRSFVLNGDIRRRKDYPTILKAFNTLGQTKSYHPNIDFVGKIGKYKKTDADKHARINTIRDPHFSLYCGEEARQRELAKIEEISHALTHHGTIYTCECQEHRPTKFKGFIPHYTFRFKWMLIEITEPHFLTHYTPIDGELESRIAKIDNEMRDNHYYDLVGRGNREWDKIHNSGWLSVKYDTDKKIVYHDLDFNLTGQEIPFL